MANDIPAGFEVVSQPAASAGGDIPPGFEIVQQPQAPVATPEQRFNMLDQARGAPPPVAKPAEPYTYVDRLRSVATGARDMFDAVRSNPDAAVDYGTIVANNLRRGVAETLAIPLNASTAIAGLLRGEKLQDPRWTEKIHRGLGLGIAPDNPRPEAFQQPGAHVVGRVAKGLGGALLPGAAVVGAARNLGVQGAPQLPGMIGGMVAQAARNPASFAAKEATAVVGSELGGELGRTLAGGGNNGAALLADLFGSFAGAVAPSGVASAGSKINNYGRAIVGAPIDDKNVRAAVADHILNAAEVPQTPQPRSGIADMLPKKLADTYTTAKARIAGGRERYLGAPEPKTGTIEPGGPIDATPLINKIENNIPRAGMRQAIPGYKPTVADVVGDAYPGVAAAERAIGGKNAGTFIKRQQENVKAIDSAVEGMAPRVKEAGGLTARLSDNVDRARKEFDDAVAALPNPGYAAARGSDIQGALARADTAARNAVRSTWQRAGSDTPVSAEDLVQRLDRARAGLPAIERKHAPNEVIDTIRRLAFDEEGNARRVSAREITALRADISEARLRAVSGPDPSRNAARILGQFERVFDRYGLSSPELASNWRAARAASLDYHQRFTRKFSAINRTLTKEKGDFAREPSAIPGDFVQPDSGRTRDFGALMREAGKDPGVQSAIRGQIVDEVQRKGLVGKPEQLDKYLRERGIVMSEMPDLKKQLDEVAAAARRVPATNDPVSKFIRYEEPEKAMATLLNGPRPVEGIKRIVEFAGGSKAVVDSAKRAVWEVMRDKSTLKGETARRLGTVDPWQGWSMDRFLQKNDRALKVLYRDNPEHLEGLKDLAKAIRKTNSAAYARSSNNSDTFQNMQYGEALTPATLQSRYYQMKTGRISPEFLGLSIAGIVGRKKLEKQQLLQFDRLLKETFADPELMAAFLRKNNPANRALLEKRAKLYLGNQASEVVGWLVSEDKGQYDAHIQERGAPLDIKKSKDDVIRERVRQ